MATFNAILTRIHNLEIEVKELRKANYEVLRQVEPNKTPFSLKSLLKLNKPEINALIALKMVNKESDAGRISEILNIKPAMASHALNSLHRLDKIDKIRKGRRVFFKLKSNSESD